MLDAAADAIDAHVDADAAFKGNQDCYSMPW
jgi:hypothetical protein